jgi:hypothetical protein
MALGKEGFLGHEDNWSREGQSLKEWEEGSEMREAEPCLRPSSLGLLLFTSSPPASQGGWSAGYRLLPSFIPASKPEEAWGPSWRTLSINFGSIYSL